jgi:hypothetical protein
MNSSLSSTTDGRCVDEHTHAHRLQHRLQVGRELPDVSVESHEGTGSAGRRPTHLACGPRSDRSRLAGRETAVRQ